MSGVSLISGGIAEAREKPARWRAADGSESYFHPQFPARASGWGARVEAHGCCRAPFAAGQPPAAAQPARGSPAATSCGGFKANASQSSYFVLLTRTLLTEGGGGGE